MYSKHCTKSGQSAPWDHSRVHCAPGHRTREVAGAYAAVLQGIASITQWLLIPSLAIVLISGLLAIAANDAYKNAAWAW